MPGKGHIGGGKSAKREMGILRKGRTAKKGQLGSVGEEGSNREAGERGADNGGKRG